MTVSTKETNEENSPQNGIPKTIESDRLQWQMHRIWDQKNVLQIPAPPFTVCEGLGKSFELPSVKLTNIVYNQVRHININANGVTEKVIKITFKSMPSVLLQQIMSYKYEVYYV